MPASARERRSASSTRRPAIPARPPLVLIMGWGGDHTAWALQQPAFDPDIA